MEQFVIAHPYVLLSCAASIDGYIDDTSENRLILSNTEDLDRVDEVRASCDAILIGANTIRRDNPRLLVNSEIRRAERAARGLPEYPVKVTITRTGLNPDFKFFNTGGEKFVYCPASVMEKIREQLGDRATVIGLVDSLDLSEALEDLTNRGIKRLMVEGGEKVHTQFLEQDLADEIHFAIAPFFVGEAGAPRFVNTGSFPQGAANRMTLAEVLQVGDVAVMRYLTRRSEIDLIEGEAGFHRSLPAAESSDRVDGPPDTGKQGRLQL
jgi:5-amino-6-(5-phosphoribosylamino)uracil reductase